MAEIDPVILELRAELGKYRADLKSTSSLVQTQLGQQERSVQRLEAQMRRSSGAISNTLRGLGATLATYFTGRELVGLIDGFTRLQNNLRVAGLEGENLARVQSQLLDLSSRYGTSVEGLSGVFLKASLAQNELGASTQQIIQLNEIVAASLKITGTSAQEAQGALLQLGQALGSGVVRAEEFNSILEGALPLAQAAARGIDGYGGSVSKLRAAVADGKITSQQFFAGVLKGGIQTIKDADKATLTLAGAFEALSSKLTVYVGQSAEANGVTGALAGGLKLLADNLDTVLDALAIIVGLMGVRYVTAVGLAAAANVSFAASGVGAASAMGAMGAAAFALQARLAGAATSMEALRFAAAGLAPALPIVAVGAIVLGLGYLLLATHKIDEATGEYKRTLDESKVASDKAREAAERLANAHGKSRAEALKNAQAEREATKQKLAGAKASLVLAQAELKKATAFRAAQNQASFGSTGLPGTATFIQGTGDTRVARARANVSAEEQAIKNFQGAIEDLTATIDAANPPAVNTSTDTGKKTPRSAETKDRADELAARASQDLYNLQIEQLRAQASLTNDIEERADLENQIIAKEREARYAELDAAVKAGELTKAQADEQGKILRALYGRRDAERNSEEIEVEGQKTLYGMQVELERRMQAERDRADIAEAKYRAEAEALRNQFDLATTDEERRAIAYRILDAEDKYLRSKLEAVIANKDLTEAVRRAAQIELEALDAGAEDRRKLVERANQGELGRYIEDISDTKARTEEAVVRQLRAVNDGITDALTSQLGIKNKFVKDMFSIFLDQVVFKPLAEALQNGGAGGGIGGFLGSVFGSIFGRASGGYNAPYSVTRVNEHAGGVELLRMGSQGGEVIPLGRVNQTASQPGGGQAGIATVRLELSGDIDARIARVSGPVAVEVVRASAPTIIEGAVGETFRRSGRPKM